jgi:two-component sensor histidine kinase
MDKPRRLPKPLDGHAIFAEAASVKGLTMGWERVRANAGSAGGDGMTIDAFAASAGGRIAELACALREGGYRPGPLRVVHIPKESGGFPNAAGGLRKLTIPCVRDRVAQSAVAQILTPLLDAEMDAPVVRVVREVIESYRFQIEQQGFELKVDLEEDLPHVPADEEALGQAIINLVNNAIKYSRESKTIHIEVRRDGSKVLVTVKDTGIGIPRSEQKKIFEKFFRGEDSLVHETKGSGLGLALVRHIMEAHGGSVEVDSTPGKGSAFTLALPVGKSGRES